MRLVICALATLSISFCSGVQNALAEGDATSKQLDRLEKRYFGRSFESDTDTRRTERLEKLVFGEEWSGELAQRISNLEAAAAASPPADNAAGNGGSANFQPAGSSGSGTSSSYSAESGQTSDAASAAPPDDDTATDNSDRYPRITALEGAILGQNYIAEKLPARLARMEIKAFGKASSDPDLSQRTDALTDYAQQKLHKNVVQTEERQDENVETANSSSSSSSSSGESEPPSAPADYPRITTLENAILGKSFVGQTLAERLNRMEMKAFGSSSKNSDMSQRTEALERYTEKTLHKKPLQEQEERREAAQGGTQQGGSGGTPKKIANFIGTQLMGMAGFSPNGFNTPGFGPGFGMPGGASGPRTRSQQAAMQQDRANAASVEPAKEDSTVHSASPPPAGARLLTKVGWCEMQVFGQTYPEYHLPQRLGQLNRELSFAPGKSDFDLMDSIPDLMKAVVAKKGQSIGAKPQAPTE